MRVEDLVLELTQMEEEERDVVRGGGTGGVVGGGAVGGGGASGITFLDIPLGMSRGP